jgi:hypothetical protein
MNCLPENAEKINIEGATVPFYKYIQNDIVFIEFDSSKSTHPEPMLNAMLGLKNLADDEKLIMINSKPPLGLFEKVKNEFSYTLSELVDGKSKIIFTKKTDSNTTSDFNDTACAGTGCSN